jgi:thioesterase domain-containing protein
MTPAELDHYLHNRIPLSRHMGVSAVAVFPDRVILRAPLAPNINQHETVFGGSASAIAILTAWSLVHTRLHTEGIPNRLVIRRNTMDYEHPTAGDFTAMSSLEMPDQWQPFIRSLAHKSKARIAVLTVLEYAGQVTGRLRAEIVALSPDNSPESAVSDAS